MVCHHVGGFHTAPGFTCVGLLWADCRHPAVSYRSLQTHSSCSLLQLCGTTVRVCVCVLCFPHIDLFVAVRHRINIGRHILRLVIKKCFLRYLKTVNCYKLVFTRTHTYLGKHLQKPGLYSMQTSQPAETHFREVAPPSHPPGRNPHSQNFRETWDV